MKRGRLLIVLCVTLTAGVRAHQSGSAAGSGAQAELVSLSAKNKVRIVQTNSAGDNVHIIDPATN
jgi:hypothetical protein